MSKLLAGSAIAIGGTGTSLAGVYLMGAFNSGDATLPETVDDFTGEKVGDCVKQYFPGVDLTKAKSMNSFPSDFPTTDGSNTAKSCLVVNWERKDYSTTDGYWKGNFRWLGSFVQGDKGFVMFNVGSNAEDQKLTLSGVLYVLKKNDSGEWTVENKDSSKGTPDAKQVTKTDFDDAFPQMADPMKGKFSNQSKKENWGFVNGKEEMEKLCKSDNQTNCKTHSKTESFKGLWTWESSSEGTSGSLTSWSGNLDKGVPNLYSGVNLKDKLSSLTGKGNEPSVFLFTSKSEDK